MAMIVMSTRLMVRFVNDSTVAFGRRRAVMRRMAGCIVFGAGRRALTAIARARVAKRNQARQNGAKQRQEDNGLIHSRA
jgi:hypothetical protein